MCDNLSKIYILEKLLRKKKSNNYKIKGDLKSSAYRNNNILLHKETFDSLKWFLLIKV